ncbi:MAG: peptidase M22, partial [Ruminococcus sp.]|nr:peptidase M22 [Ruminococcus sp.]
MAEFLGIDTSNYTTSVAVYDNDNNKIYQSKKLLPVKSGSAGLRQSDAVFHHTRQLPEMMEELFSVHPVENLKGVSVSVRPRNTEGSYMPCFLCGEGLGRSISAMNKIPLYRTSHQTGHILSALYSADRLSLIKENFIAFHVSGGTTDCLLCKPSETDIIDIIQVGTSLDLKAGQLVDRVG